MKRLAQDQARHEEFMRLTQRARAANDWRAIAAVHVRQRQTEADRKAKDEPVVPMARALAYGVPASMALWVVGAAIIWIILS